MENKSKQDIDMSGYYFTAGFLATVSIGLFAWSFWPKDYAKEAEKEYQKRIRAYGI